MGITVSACRQVQPLVGFPGGLSTDLFLPRHRKEKVVVVIGATGTGKSKLSIDLATRFPAEIVNSDKIQVYKGLDILTNKVTEDECHGVPHYLLGIADPNADFTAVDFRRHALLAVDSIIRRGHLPIIAGGSNSYIKALVHDDPEFRSKYQCCFLWVDVALPVLYSFVSERVDRMVEAGLVDEVRQIFDSTADYTRGIRRAIGVPELDQFLRTESRVDNKAKTRLLNEAIKNIKWNTRELARRQLNKILTFQSQLKWKMHRLDATEAFQKRGGTADDAWEELVVGPSVTIVDRFLYGGEDHMTSIPVSTDIPAAASALGNRPTASPAIVTATL
ncbi:Adenylate dimethylallyltransferase [Bertholletia excelsa]